MIVKADGGAAAASSVATSGGSGSKKKGAPAGDREIAVNLKKQFKEDDDNQTAAVELGFDLLPGQHIVLVVRYQAELSDDNDAGFFHFKMNGFDGKPRWMGATQFEAVAARSAFPCWDEPAFKCTFALTVACGSELQVISNMPVASDTPFAAFNAKGKEESRHRVAFQTSPIMSSYLLAWAIGQFDSLSAPAMGGLPITVYTPVGRKDQGQFALEIACRCIEAYQRYFAGVPYPLPKLDLVAVPEFEAMENWGCCIFGDEYLLVVRIFLVLFFFW